MNVWLMMGAIGLLTFLTRLSFIALLERFRLPPILQRALRFVPIAVLSAIIAPEVGYLDNRLFLSLQNPRLLAAIVATLVAYYTKNVVWTIVVGMVVFWLLGMWG
ncbi:MAG: AzlD domain-containing protein [Anaerolineales bacterium]|nr:AzlD domain-containing protein [Anaerolineales bacterium]MCX7755289.1 AzlD domain-containing protein [Anaerolineales bacterium]MDW8278464.1 AzlD domain-containing protein [Anaerolineales bacterium]